MIWFILALLALAAAWVGVGLLMLARDSRRQGTDYRREVAGRVYTVGDTIEVALSLKAPARARVAEDHDVVLAVDHSSSMGGGPGSPLREALRAAENFIQRLPGNVHIGLVAFDHAARVVCPLTGDRGRALRAAAGIGAGGGTAIDAALGRSREALSAGRPNVRKTLVLLSDGGSDYGAAVAAAAPMRDSNPPTDVIAVGFGPHVNEALMRGVSTGGDKYLHVDKPEDLYGLFGFLASAVSGQQAAAGTIDEGARAPDPFRLTKTGGLYPVGVKPENPTRVMWSVPLMDEAPVPLTYHLVAQCPGWHAVATPDSRATWRSPDGGETQTFGPTGPRVLVMPRWLGWAWPILNPLFWALFGRLWPCAVARGAGVAAVAAVAEPLPSPTLPALLPAPQARLYEPQLRPALVVGLGEVGERTVCRLKERFRDRQIDPSKFALFAVHVTHRANRQPVKVGGVSLDADEQIELHQDLRPYLETLRGDGTPPMRAWVPWRAWLAEMQPLSTSRTISDDRRKARLALLRKPAPVETKLAPALRRVIDQQGVVVLTGAADDAECSGLLAEVAHVCAEQGAGVTAVFAPAGFGEPSASVPALAQELERMTLMSGNHITSDRSEPLARARRLFDRVVVLERQGETAEQSSAPTAEFVWNMLAFDEVFKTLPSVRADGDRVMCCGVVIDGQPLPAAKLWRWARERTLAVGVNGNRLGLVPKNGRLTLPAPDRQAAAADVESFWTGQNCQRPQNSLLRGSLAVLQGGGADPVSAVIALQDELPADSPYHEQVAYSERERRLFVGYFEEWCQYVLEREQGGGGWGVHKLLAAVLRVEEDFKTAVNRINRLSGNTDFAVLVGFASAMYADFLAVVSNVRRGLTEWLATLVGPQPEWNVDATPRGRQPLCYDIEAGRHASEEELYVPSRRARQFVEQEFDKWFRTYGDPLLGQLRFGVVAEPGGQRLDIKLRHQGREWAPGDDLAGFIRSALDDYRSVVLGWPLDQWVTPDEVAQPFDRLRVGKHSRLIYPTVERALDEDDPFTAAALRVRERPLRSALGVEAAPGADLPYAWPEEANAVRIAQKIRNRLRYDPRPFTPVAVHLMRDTHKLAGFINDLAQGRVFSSGTRFVLRRDGHDYEIGPSDENLRGLDAFQHVAQQVVSLELSLDGDPIPPPPNSLGVQEEVMRAVEGHPLGRAAADSPNWQMWRDIIRGLWLEHEGSANGVSSTNRA